MKRLMRLTASPFGTPERKWLTVAVLLTLVFGVARYLRAPATLWIAVLFADLCCCAVLKNMETRQIYHGLPKDGSPVSEEEVAEHTRYVKFLGDLIQLGVGIAFSIIISLNFNRMGL